MTQYPDRPEPPKPQGPPQPPASSWPSQPDAPPPFYSPPTMPVAAPTRPGWITALGIISIVLGSMGLLCCGCVTFGMGMLPFVKDMDHPSLADNENVEQAKTLLEEQPGYYAAQVAFFGAHFILSVILIVGGAGLLRLKPTGRALCLTWAIASPCLVLGDQVLDMALGKWKAAGLFPAAVALVFPIVLLACLLPSHRAAWFRRGDGRAPDQTAPPGYGPPLVS